MKKGTMRFRLFITCLVIFLLPLGLLGIIGGSWASNTVTQNTEDSYATVLKNVADRLDADIASLASVVTLISGDPLIKRLTYMQGNRIDYGRISAIDLQNYRSSLIFISMNNRLYSDIAICFPTKKVAITKLGLWNLDWFFDDEFHIASMTYETWMELFSKGSSEVFIRNANLSIFGNARTGLACVRTATRNAKGQALVSLLFWIDSQKLDSYFSDLALFPGTIAAVSDQEGRPLHVYAGEDNPKDALDYVIEPNEGRAFTSESGERYRVMGLVSPQSHWRYTVLLPQNEIYAQVHQLNRAIAVILAVMLLVGCGLSLELAHINYRPLQRIFRTLSVYLAPQDEKKHGEMAQIEWLLTNMMSQQDALRQQIDSNRRLLQYAALSHLLEGDASFHPATGRDMLMMLDLPMPYPCFSLCVPTRGYEALIPKAASAAEQAGMKAYTVQQKGLPILVINHGDLPLAPWAMALPEEGNGLCFSDAHMSIAELPTALEEVMMVRKHRMAQTRQALFYRNMPAQDHTPLLSAQAERQISDAVREGKHMEAVALFDQSLARNREKLTHYTAEKWALAIDLLVMKTDDGKDSLSASLQGIAFPQDDQPEVLLAFARQLLTKAAEYHAQQNARRKQEYMETLIAYIDERLYDPQLSLAMTADFFHMAPTYLSRYFKEQMGVGYLDYVNRKRINAAKKLLREDPLSIKEVASATGFASDATFRRLFKKYEGHVPSRVHSEDG